MTTTYRPICGTHQGLARHQTAGEPACGKCREGELRRRLDAERAPSHPAPDPAGRTGRVDITDADAADHRATLARALKETR